MSFNAVALKALHLLEEASKPGKLLPYNEATGTLSRLRLDRKTALKLLSELAELGLVEQSCGHGIKIKEGQDARRGVE